MKANPKAPKKEQPAPDEVELVPDAWPRFEKFVRDIAKAPPKHKAAEKVGVARKRKPAERDS